MFPLLFDDTRQVRGKYRLYKYLTSLGLTLNTRLNEASGNIINYGTDGNTGVPSGITQFQTGQMGAGEAVSFDGIDDYIQFTNASLPLTKALTTQRWLFLVRPNTLGEGGVGRFFRWDAPSTSGLLFNGVNQLTAFIDTTGIDANAVTNINQVDFLATWALVFMDYDDANTLGFGRKIRLFRSTLASAATQLTLLTDTAGTGTVVTPTADLYLHNNSTLSGTFDGLSDHIGAGAGLWTVSIMANIRLLVFGV